MIDISLRDYFHNEEGFKAIAEKMVQPIWIADPMGNVIWMNQSCRNYTGKDTHNVKVHEWENVCHPIDIDDLRKSFQRSVQDKSHWVGTFKLDFGNGDSRWFLSRADPILDEYGNIQRWIGVNTDITQQKDTEAQLRISKSRYEYASLASRDIIWDWNLGSNDIQWNQAMETQLGYKLPDNTSSLEWWEEHIHPEDREKALAGFLDAVNEGKQFWDEEYRFLKADGSYAVLRDRGYVVFNEKGEPTRMIGAMLDVTWERKAITHLTSSKKAAEKASAAKSNFLANVSHEVRTPLSSILGYAELIKSSDLDKKALNEFITIIERSGHQVLNIIDDVLDLAKVEAGTLEIQRRAFLLKNTLFEALNDTIIRAQDKGVRVDVQIEKQTPEVFVTDPVRLRQVLTNLVGNAVKFTDQGVVKLEVSYKSPCLRLLVSDTGVGIPEKLRKKIFLPFKQGEAKLSPKYEGSGLGLALTRSICQAMHGDLNLVSSKVGEGSVFEATISAEPATREELEGIFPGSEEHPLEGKRILVIDDSGEIRMLVQKLLGKVGANVDAANGGEKGIELALANKYDIILLDIQMPGMDGYDTLKEMKKLGIEAPVCALTAHAMKQDRERAMRAGFEYFVTKPMKVERIVRLVRSLE